MILGDPQSKHAFFICGQVFEPCYVQFTQSLRSNVILIIASVNHYPNHPDVRSH